MTATQAVFLTVVTLFGMPSLVVMWAKSPRRCRIESPDRTRRIASNDECWQYPFEHSGVDADGHLVRWPS